MRYCKNCGAELKDEAHFCKECGNPVTRSGTVSKPVEKEMTTTSAITEPAERDTRNSHGRSKRTNLKWIIALLIFILLTGTYYYFDKIYYSPDKVFEDFTNAIDTKDVHKVKTYLNDGQREMKVTDKQTEIFINDLHNNPKIYSDLYTNLKTEANYYKKKVASSKDSSELSAIANLKANGKKWGIFDHYVIEVKPYYVNVISNYENTIIEVDEEELGNVTEDQEKTIGPFLPGEHTIKATINGDYGKVSQSMAFSDSSLEDRTTSVKFNWSDYFFTIYTNEEDATLFVNGKSTKKTLKEIDSFGPVALDGSVKVHAEMKSGKKTIKSDTVTIKDGIYGVELYFEEEDLYASEENSEDNETSAEEDVAEDNKKSTEEESDKVDEKAEASQIESVIYSHYQNITNDNFEAAYNLFSSEKRSELSLSDWSKGLKANQADQVNVLNVTEVNSDTAVAYVEITSYDNNEDGTTLVQEWGGDWYLVKENGNWCLSKAKLSKLSTKTES